MKSEVIETAAGISYRRLGSGVPLILIHGIGSRREVWNPILDDLAPHREVYAIDLPGFGNSPADPDGGVNALVDRVATFIKELQLDQPEVSGNSMGGGIALELARRGLVGRVTAFAPIGFWNSVEKAASKQVLLGLRRAAKTAGWLVGNTVGSTVGAPATLTLYGNPLKLSADQRRIEFAGLRHSPGFARALRSFEMYDFSSNPQLDAHPIRIVWGTRDVILHYAPQSRRAKRRLPHAEHITLKGAGHLPFADDPQGCTSALVQW